MSIRKFYLKRKKPGYKLDSKTGLWTAWGYDIYNDHGERIRDHGFPTEKDAERAAARIKFAQKDAQYGVRPNRAAPTLEMLTQRRLATIANQREHARSLRTFRHLLSVVGKLAVRELTRSHLQAFVDKRLGDGLKPSSVDRELNIIVATLNGVTDFFPELEGWIRPKTPRPKGRKSRRERVLSTEEVTKLLTWLFGPKRPREDPRRYPNRLLVGQILKFALMSGARHGEVNHIRWEHIDWERRQVQIVGTKTQHVSASTSRYVPITDAMLEIFLDRKEHNSKSPYVFTVAGNTSPAFYKILRAAADATGVAYGARADGGWVLHDCRHSFVTNLLHAGVDLATIQSLTGHSSRIMALGYAHASVQSRTNAAQIMTDLMSPKERKTGE